MPDCLTVVQVLLNALGWPRAGSLPADNGSCGYCVWLVKAMNQGIKSNLRHSTVLLALLVLISLLIVIRLMRGDGTVEQDFKGYDTVPDTFRVLVTEKTGSKKSLTVKRLTWLYKADREFPDRDWMVYSFDVPPGEGTFEQHSRSVVYSVTRLTPTRQLVTVIESGNTFYSESRYENEFENIYPLYHKHTDTRGTDFNLTLIILFSLAAFFVLIKTGLPHSLVPVTVLRAIGNRYFRFAIIASAFLAFPYSCAFTSDMLGTAVVSLPALIFLVASLILGLMRILQKEQMRYNTIIIGCCLLLIPSLGIPIGISNRGLHDLTQKRVKILRELRPVFMKYKMETGAYPGSLEDLVPDYIPKVPPELVNDGKDDPYKKISYALEGERPFFYFRTIRGPDSAAIYNMVENTFWHDR
jgi:hypothetical protein